MPLMFHITENWPDKRTRIETELKLDTQNRIGAKMWLLVA